MQKKWAIKQAENQELISKLSSELNINEIFSNLLIQRGINSYDEAKHFFRPSIQHLHDPFLMKDMDIAVERIKKAIKENEKIIVYGDYDVDGTTAVALVYSFFSEFTSNIEYYIPDRYKEGYGISIEGINYAEQKETKLIIALDCGIKAIDIVATAKEKGIDFIICDHHRPGETIPKAAAVLDPLRTDCYYPYKFLSGCGVGFKFVQAFCIEEKIAFSSIEKHLDLVAISIASDIVPVTGENRTLAYFGLKRLNSFPRIGIETILKYCNINRTSIPITSSRPYVFNKELSITDIVFLIGPRINAAGRLENGKTAVDLLIADNDTDAANIGRTIDETNKARRTLDTAATEKALEIIDSNCCDVANKNSIATFIFDKDWHKGIIGIVASRLTEHYYRPTIVLTESQGLITGSARSIKGFDIHNAIKACDHLLEHYGGHKYAAGLSLKPENLEEFGKLFTAYVKENINNEMLIPEIEIESELDFLDITSNFYSILKQFAPFGPGNMMPVFQTNEVIDKGFARIVGQNHLKLYVSGKKNKCFQAIAFNHAEKFTTISEGKSFNMCYQIEENEWNGKKTMQLNVKDIDLY